MSDSVSRADDERVRENMGKVFLVGAGPGDPELLTVRALRLLQRADVVLHDALVSAEILALVSPRARVIDIGKRRGMKLLTQQEINTLLIGYAVETETVVRLKGGDPSIFGRAGEEIEELVEAGIEFEIVPGITAALASAAAAGISLTDRRFASAVLFTTAQRHAQSGAVAWKKLVATGATLAIYMPAPEIGKLCKELRESGLPSSTPCTVVSRAGRLDQRIISTDLSRLPRDGSVPSPALLFVGECARPLHALAHASMEAVKIEDNRAEFRNA